MRVAIVGCGYWGSKHVRVFAGLPAVTEVHLVDRDTAMLESIGTEFPSTIPHRDLGEVLDDVDAVVVATPPESHHQVAGEALAAGKHVLVEKPMAVTSAACLDLWRMAEASGLTLAVGHTFVYNAAVVKLRELVASGELGDIHYLDSARLNLGLYRHDVNVLWDLAAHDISITNMVLGQYPTSVSAWGSRHTTQYAEDVASLRLSYESINVDATIRVSWLDPLKVRRTTVVGSEKMAVYNDMSPDERIKIFDRGRERQAQEPSNDAFNLTYRYGAIVAPYVDFREPLRVQAEDFLAACQTGAESQVGPLDGLAVVAALEGCDRSISEGGIAVPLEIPSRPLTSSDEVAA